MLNAVSQAVGEKAFGKLGIEFSLHNYPKARALVSANAGVVDGDAYRVVDFHKKTNGKYSNLLIVNVPFMSIHWTAFVTDKLKNAQINGWDDMKNYKVVGIRGNKTMEFRMKEHLSDSNRHLVTHYEQAFGMLFKGRIDIVIAKPSVGKDYLKKHKNLHMVGKFEVQDLYFYLHKKHQNLIPKLESELKQLKDNGTLRKLETSIRAS